MFDKNMAILWLNYFKGNYMKNEVILQGFEWDLPADSQHWNRLKEMSSELKDYGFTAVWFASLHIKVQRASKMLAMVFTTTTILENLIKRINTDQVQEPKMNILKNQSVARSGVGGLRRYCIQSFDRSRWKRNGTSGQIQLGQSQQSR